jgi:hypothetical protein
MGSLRHVVRDVGPEHSLEVPTTVDQDVVEALLAHGPHKALREGVRPRCPDRRSDDPDALGAEHRIEGPEYLASRSRSRNRTPDSRSSTARFRACPVTHVESGYAVTPATCTRRVESSMKNRT